MLQCKSIPKRNTVGNCIIALMSFLQLRIYVQYSKNDFLHLSEDGIYSVKHL